MSRLMIAHLLVATLLCGMSASMGEASEQPGSLSAADIQAALVDKVIDYSPPGWADAGISEVFHSDGRWTGFYSSRGPIDFAGRWFIEDNRICVAPDTKSIVSKWFSGARCRRLWRGGHDHDGLLIEHLDPRQTSGPLVVRIKDLSSIGH